MAPTPHFSVSVAGGSGGTISGCPRSSLPDSAQTQGTHLQCSLGSRSWARLTCSLSWTKYWTPNPIPTWPPPHPRVFTETLLWDRLRSRFHSRRLHSSRTQQTLKPEPCGCPTPALWTLLLLKGFAEARVVLLAHQNRWRTVRRHRWRPQDAEVHRPGWRARTTQPTQL